jgi:hypothetical protein
MGNAQYMENIRLLAPCDRRREVTGTDVGDTEKVLEDGPSRIVRSWASYLEPDRNWPNETGVAS